MNLGRKILVYLILFITLATTAYIAVCYTFNYSKSVRSGVLTKFGEKGYIFKTWEGEMSQGAMSTQLFQFSVLRNETQLIEDLKKYQGKYVKIEYNQKLRTFPWWGDTTYYVISVTPESK